MRLTELFKPVGWAVYLACSWTWCIGMFLPSLLLRDFGWGSWAAFVVPNVVGAAAMGFVFSHSAASKVFITRHRSACLGFSVVTILFQFTFLLWATTVLLPHGMVMGCLLIIFCCLFWFSREWDASVLVASSLVFFVSLIAMVFFAKTLPFSWSYLSDPAFGRLAPQLRCLMPVFVFGFLLSPYLDLTFHHVNQQTSGPTTKFAFVIGFGFFFFLMMVFSLLYAPSVIDLFFWTAGTKDAGFRLVDRMLLQAILCIHIVVQASLTAILHLHRLRQQGRGGILGRILLIQFLIVPLLLFIVGRNITLFGFTGHELIYRTFMAFYGLLAPSYIWICAIPFKTKGKSPKVDWLVCGGAILLALPFYAWAFMAGKYPALVPGIGIVISAPLFRGRYYKWVGKTPSP